MLFAFVVLNIFTIAYALPYGDSQRNVITVPPNCPGDQVWINGACRDIWRAAAPSVPQWKISDISPANVVTVPPNCPPGQEFINGQCRDVWRSGDLAKISDISPANVITVPPNCPPGQEYINGQCRDIWRVGDLANSLLLKQKIENLWNEYIRKIQQARVDVVDNSNVVNNSPRHIINVPNQCPIGFKADALGICRPIL